MGAVRPHVRGPGQPAHRLVVVPRRQQVGALEPLKLQSVLEQAQEFVGGGQVRGVVAADVTAGSQRSQRVDRGCYVQRGVGAPVYQLQQLHGELHVAKSPGPQFQLAIADVHRNQRLHPPAHGLHLGDEVLPVAGGPDHRHQGVHVLLGQLGVADRRAGLEQRLELPGLGPFAVVGDMGFAGAHQRTRLALRPQCGVDFEERLRGQSHHLPRHPGGERFGVLADEDHVDVADVVQFPGTALAHRDDGQPRRLGVFADRRDGHLQGGLQCGVGQIREVLAHGGKLQHRLVLHSRSHIERGQDQQLFAVVTTQLRHDNRWFRAEFGNAIGEAAAQVVPPGQPRLPFQNVPGVRVGHQVVTEGQRRAEHREQPAAQGAVGLQRRIEQRPVIAERLGQPHQGVQRDIGIGCARQRPQQLDVRVAVPAQPGQVAECGGFQQPKTAHAGHTGTLRRWSGHAHDAIAAPGRGSPPPGQSDR